MKATLVRVAVRVLWVGSVLASAPFSATAFDDDFPITCGSKGYFREKNRVATVLKTEPARVLT